MILANSVGRTNQLVIPANATMSQECKNGSEQRESDARSDVEGSATGQPCEVGIGVGPDSNVVEQHEPNNCFGHLHLRSAILV